MGNQLTPKIVEQFKSVYNELNIDTIGRINEIYTENIVLSDPFHEIKGMKNLLPYFENLYKGVRSIHFDFDKEAFLDDRGSITWTMHLDHKSLTKKAVVPGITYMEFGDKIHLHRDYFDAGAMIYENVPVLGSAVRFIKARL